MANHSRRLLFLSIAIVCSVSSAAANPMQDALRRVQCVARGYTFTVKVAGCQERSVTINTCLGVCLSFSTPTGANYKQVESCTCCRQIKTEKVDVGLWCQDKADPSNLVKYFHPIETATECACASCWYSWLKRPCKSMNAQRFYEMSGYWSCQNFFFSLKWRRVWTRQLKLKLSKNKTKQKQPTFLEWL